MSADSADPPGAVRKKSDMGDSIRERWDAFLLRRSDSDGNARGDLLHKGTRELRKMQLVTRDERPAPAGAPAPAVFAGVTWVGIGPQPLQIDQDKNFQGRGPDSGEVVDILIDPTGTTDAVMYLAVNNGGVWKTTDGGTTWSPKTDFMPSLSMGGLAMDPGDHDIIYAGTGNNFDGGAQGIRGHGIYRSIDAGETWTVLADTLFAAMLIVRIVMPAPDMLLVATNSGLFRSVDGGQSFGANAPHFNDNQPVLTG